MSDINTGDLVSVIIPAYNHSKYVEYALDSVYAQSYKNIELIFLDDCSKDETLSIALAWAHKNDAESRFFKVIIEKNPENLGAHDSINRGIALSTGKAITILNSDDAFEENRIEALVESACSSHARWLFTGVKVINEFNGKAEFSELVGEVETAFDYASTLPSVSFALLKKNITITTGNLFFSKKLYDQVGKFRPLRYCHDWDFALRASLIAEPVFIDAPLYQYRVHGTNSFASLKFEQYLETQIVYEHYFSNCRAGNCKNSLAPWTTNWPVLFDKFVSEDANLSGSFDLVGKESVKYDHMTRMIKSMFETTT